MKIEIIIDVNTRIPIVKIDGKVVEGLTEIYFNGSCQNESQREDKWELMYKNIDMKSRKIVSTGYKTI